MDKEKGDKTFKENCHIELEFLCTCEPEMINEIMRKSGEIIMAYNN